MLPARPSRSPPDAPDPPHYHRPPPEDDRRIQPPPPRHLPSLPSIHQLHPDLPSASTPHHRGQPSYVTAYSARDPGPSYGTRPPPEMSDNEGEPPGPPKKKRRRQALSCTECKRRKIKCDRAQPCGPCTRRGEQIKCQWHIIEPMEKYVTRTEYDDLKARFDQLEASIQRILPGYAMPSTSHPSTVSPTITGAAASPGEPAQPTVIQIPFRPRESAASNYASDMPSPASSSARGGEPPYHHSPVPMARAIQHVPRPRSPPFAYQGAPPVPAQTSYASRAPQRSPRALSRSPPPPPRAEASRAPGTRRVSISLTDLTSPNHVGPYAAAAAAPPASYGHQQHQQPPKNRRAQTVPPLGHRLRQALRAPIGSAAGHPRRHTGRQAHPHPVRITPPRTTPLTARLRLMTTRRRNRTRRARMLPPITDASPVTKHGVTLVVSECSLMLLRNACYVGG